MTQDQKGLLERRILELYGEAIGGCCNYNGAFGMDFGISSAYRVDRIHKIKEDLDKLIGEL